VDEDERRQIVYADDVNSYLREITDATSRRRTSARGWARCSPPRRCATWDRRHEARGGAQRAERDRQTAERLGNTRAVCRKYYIHPVVIEAYLEGSVLPPLPDPVWQERRTHGPTLRRHEAEVLAFLKARIGTRRSR
jgi:DNA topoisomerase-1